MLLRGHHLGVQAHRPNSVRLPIEIQLQDVHWTLYHQEHFPAAVSRRIVVVNGILDVDPTGFLFQVTVPEVRPTHRPGGPGYQLPVHSDRKDDTVLVITHDRTA